MSQRYIGGLIYNPPGGFSGYFDGSGDRLVVAGNAAFNFGTGDFTVECWFYTNSVSANQWIVGPDNTVTYPWALQTLGTAVRFISNNAANDFRPTGFTLATGVWNHFAVTRSGSTMYWFVNGVLSGTQTYSTSIGSNTIDVQIGTTGSGSGDPVNGYISNLRVVKGTAVYTASFNPPTGQLQAITNTSLLTCAYPTFRDGSSNNFTITVNGNTAVSTQNPFPLTALPNPALGNQGNGVYTMSQYQALRSQNLWPAIDPWFDYVTLMLHGNGTNGAQNNTFLDSSTNNFTITRNGNTTQGTFTPYGDNWGNYFPSNSSLSFNYTSGIALSNTYTIECWINPDSVSQGFLFSMEQSNTGGFAYLSFYVSSGQIGAATRPSTNGTEYYNSAGSISVGVWQHVAIVNNAGTAQLYVNGVAVGTTFSMPAMSTTPSFVAIGQRANGFSPSATYYTGYISNMRITTSAVYTGNFTPSTSPFPALANTKLLTCQSNRFVDNSTNAYALTASSTSVQRFSPFNPTTPYTAGTIGGSGYFDGSGDYLTTPASSQFNPAGDFTIGLWFYPNSALTINQNLIGNLTANASTDWLIQMVSNTLSIYTNGTTVRISSATAVVPFQWNYISVTRSSNVISAHVNGSSIGTYSQSGAFGSASKAIEIGNATNNINGYISGIFLRDGTADTTVPAAPRTNVSGTSLLLNFTNGGIIDNAMMNDLETVGNAQISTTQSKFGGASLYLDGSGDYLVSAATNLPFTFGTGDFTVECWLYPASVSGGTITIVSNRFDAGADTVLIFAFGTTNGLFFHTQATAVLNSGTNLTASTWQHVALCRAGGTVRIFLNGVQVGSSVSSAQNLSATASVFVGQDGTKGAGAAAQYNGYMDDLRITKYARYTANFTPQRSQWQDQ